MADAEAEERYTTEEFIAMRTKSIENNKIVMGYLDRIYAERRTRVREALDNNEI
jgi:hypothetical protein